MFKIIYLLKQSKYNLLCFILISIPTVGQNKLIDINNYSKYKHLLENICCFYPSYCNSFNSINAKINNAYYSIYNHMNTALDSCNKSYNCNISENIDCLKSFLNNFSIINGFWGNNIRNDANIKLAKIYDKINVDSSIFYLNCALESAFIKYEIFWDTDFSSSQRDSRWEELRYKYILKYSQYPLFSEYFFQLLYKDQLLRVNYIQDGTFNEEKMKMIKNNDITVDSFCISHLKDTLQLLKSSYYRYCFVTLISHSNVYTIKRYLPFYINNFGFSDSSYKLLFNKLYLHYYKKLYYTNNLSNNKKDELNDVNNILLKND